MVLFMQGGELGGFATIALNRINTTWSADYILTGTLSNEAAKETAKYGKVNPLVYPLADRPGSIPDQLSWNLNRDTSYFYYCDNKTVDGVEFPFISNNPHNVPLVADMSSSTMIKSVYVSKFGLESAILSDYISILIFI
ncbi:hypothetical protein WA026_019319 [Henosepilachna vigintioctopunctata]|uniref:Aminotransferase class V domain-containing protein n=1 Tax=Henosepilachna vigintioctopunctata TaxID=420089 RepID=A0AAW1UEE5_9CUCU